MKKKVNVVLILVALVLVGTAAHAQGVMFVKNNKVGIGTDTPDELLHLEISSGQELKMRLEQSASNAWAYSVVNSNPTRPNAFRISKQGSGGPEIDVIGRNDPGGQPTMDVSGSIRATNVTFSSARELKTGFEQVDPVEMLNKLAQLELSTWEYKQGSPGKHIGPIAEDFEQVFQLGTNGKTISVVDANGIAMAAIQGLYVEVQKRDQTIEELAAQIRALQQQVEAITPH